VATATDIVDVPDPGAGIVMGVKFTVTPLAEPPLGGVTTADSVTTELNEPVMVVLTVDEPLRPGATESDVGETDMLKFAAIVTVNPTVVVAEVPPPVPVTTILYFPAAVPEPT